MINENRQKISVFAKKLGFDLVGFTKANVNKKYLKAFNDWLKNSFEGEMSYMSEHGRIEARRDLRKILNGAKSVIVLAINYYKPQKPLKKGFGRIARYAYGRDYHKIIWKKLKKLENFIQKDLQKYTTAKIYTKSYVDTGPILERALAEQAGIGTIGKNSCLITEKFGSWVFLAEIITNIDLIGDIKKPQQKGKFRLCGNCERCMKACPAQAIIKPGIIDSRRCISYLTIENKGKISKKFGKAITLTRRLFGCDVCQEVCPHNIAHQKSTKHNEFLKPKIASDQLSLRKISSIKNDAQFLKLFAGSPLMRTKRTGLQRNARIIYV